MNNDDTQIGMAVQETIIQEKKYTVRRKKDKTSVIIYFTVVRKMELLYHCIFL